MNYLGILQNDIGGEITALMILGAASFLTAGKAGIVKAWEWIKENRRTVLAIEGVALAFFAFWIWIRGMNPEIAYTENMFNVTDAAANLTDRNSGKLMPALNKALVD